MLIRRPADIPPSEITPRSVYLERRRFLGNLASVGGVGGVSGMRRVGALALSAMSWPSGEASAQVGAGALGPLVKSAYSTNETPNSLHDISHYNNFYEFGVDKAAPAAQAHTLVTRPWTVRVEGLVKKPRQIAIEDILKLAPLEERIYRLRCVEGWSMVIPWVGFPLERLIRWAEPLSDAKFVEFVSLHDPKQMPGQMFPVLRWPYVEGLRLDEATHPLALLAVGLYGDILPKQNGAPVRIVVPWKYGFKSGKSIVALRFVAQQPVTSWMRAAPSEYGFYSNVNPDVDHPRWSQARERRIGEFGKRKTLPFNGYAEQVAGLYAGMDLRKQF